MKYEFLSESVYGTVRLGEDAIAFTAERDAEAASFSAAFLFPAWEEGTYVLLPACAYNGNRFRRVERSYPPMYTEEECGVCPEPLLTDVPALAPDGSGRIEVTAGDLSVPSVGLFFPRRKQAFFLFTEQQCKGKNLGFSVERGRVEIAFPAMRRERYRMCLPNVPSEDSGISVRAGETISSRVRIYTFSCEGLSAFFDFFFRHRRCLLSDPPAPNGYTRALWDVMEAHFNAENWSGEYYAETSKIWQCGWVGGGMSSLPLLRYGTALSKERAITTLDYMTSHVWSGGLFVTVAKNGENDGDGFGQPHLSRAVLSRKAGDGLAFLLKHFDAVKPKPAWVGAARRCADAFVRIYERYGDFGQLIDGELETLYFGGTTCGASVIGALVRAWRYFEDARYLAIAKEAGERYYRRFVEKGLTYGGPGEALCAPDSESAFAMVESMVLLYEATGENAWLVRAKDSAHLFSSWVMPYAYRFPKESEFGKRGVNTVGSVFANVQNKHSAPGICTSSGEALYKLYRHTGDKAYLELLRDIALFIPQCVSTRERPVHSWNTPPETLSLGSICERVNTSDWEGRGGVGGVFNASCWCETSLILTFSELAWNEEIARDLFG